MEAIGDIDHPARRIAEEYPANNVQDYINIDQTELDMMELTKSDSNDVVYIPNALKKRILSLKDFWKHWGDRSTKDWTVLTIDNFDAFLTDGMGTQTQPVPASTNTPTTGTPTTAMDVTAITNLDEACSLDTSCDLLHHLDSPSLSSELQDNTSVDSIEIEFLPESEGQFDLTNLSPTDVFSEHHDYELFLLQNKIDAPNDNPDHYDIHTCEIQDDILSNTFAQPKFLAQHNCQDQEPTDDPNAVPTASQASCDHTLKPKCAHHPMVTQCNQSQYLTFMKKKGVHSPYAIQASHTNLSNSLVSQYPTERGEHVLKRSATSTGKQDTPVQWFKFIHPSPKRMTKTPFQIAVHMAYSPITFMNYKWTINLHDGYPLFQVMKSEGYITPSLHILKHDLSNLAPPKGEIKSSFSWTSLFKSPTSSTLCFGEPTLGKLNQVKLLCSISSSTLWDPTLAKSNRETELCITKHIPLCDSSVHTGTPFSVPSSSSKQTEFPTATPA